MPVFNGCRINSDIQSQLSCRRHWGTRWVFAHWLQCSCCHCRGLARKNDPLHGIVTPADLAGDNFMGPGARLAFPRLSPGFRYDSVALAFARIGKCFRGIQIEEYGRGAQLQLDNVFGIVCDNTAGADVSRERCHGRKQLG